MSDDGLFDEMSIPWQGPARSLTVDEDTASRMLDGSITASDAPPGYSRVADVLAAAAAPPTSAELAGEGGVRAVFRAARAAGGPAPRKRGSRSKVLVLAATVASLVLVSGLAAAVATGTFDAASDTSGSDGSPNATNEGERGTRGNGSASDDETAGDAAEQAGGPDATGAAAVGLCRAYGSGQGDKSHARAFRALAAAASASPGSTDDERIASYCAAVIAAETPAVVPSAPPTEPGGNGNGNGNAGGNGNGNSNAGGNGNGNSNAGGNAGGNGNSNAGGNGNGNGNGGGNG
jgi:hypothetical protein